MNAADANEIRGGAELRGEALGDRCHSDRAASDAEQRYSFIAGRVLVVEDDYFLAFELRNELIRRGADVIGPAGDLDRAFELARSSRPIDAAVVDINLHGELAFPLVDELVRSDVTVVFSTGYEQEVVPYRLRHVAHYVKPAPVSEIVQGLADLLAEQASR